MVSLYLKQLRQRGKAHLEVSALLLIIFTFPTAYPVKTKLLKRPI